MARFYIYCADRKIRHTYFGFHPDDLKRTSLKKMNEAYKEGLDRRFAECGPHTIEKIPQPKGGE